MSLFGFGDIKFNKLPGLVTGPLKNLEQSGFNSKTLRYPIDIGNTDKGHYVVFYIREQSRSSYANAENPSNPSVTQSSQLPTNVIEKYSSEVLGKINSVSSSLGSSFGNFVSGGTGVIQKSISDLFSTNSTFSLGTNSNQTTNIIDNSIKQITDKRFIQTTRQTKGAIALYMPDSLLFRDEQTYEGLAPGNQFILGQTLAAARSAVDEFRRSGGGATGEEAAGAAITKSGKLAVGSALAGAGGPVGRLIFTGLTGAVVNPMLELIYTSPNFRSFDFDFIFYPRDEKEAFQVQEIINEFRFHQAPELVKDAQGFLLPPSEFDIKFYYGGKQNPNLQQVSTCVLKNVQVDYAPNGFSAYEVEGQTTPRIGGTGMPVAIRMQLDFQEVTYLTKQDFKDSPDQLSEYTRASQAGEYGTS